MNRSLRHERPGARLQNERRPGPLPGERAVDEADGVLIKEEEAPV